MRKQRIKRELAALGYEPFRPSDEQRQAVRIHRFNGLSEERIAAHLGISRDELVYHFHNELEYSHDEIVGFAAERMISLAGQSTDLGVAFRANELILKSRNKLWRIPKDEPEEPQRKAIEKMGLAELEAELEALDARRRDAVQDPKP